MIASYVDEIAYKISFTGNTCNWGKTVWQRELGQNSSNDFLPYRECISLDTKFR